LLSVVCCASCSESLTIFHEKACVLLPVLLCGLDLFLFRRFLVLFFFVSFSFVFLLLSVPLCPLSLNSTEAQAFPISVPPPFIFLVSRVSTYGCTWVERYLHSGYPCCRVLVLAPAITFFPSSLHFLSPVCPAIYQPELEGFTFLLSVGPYLCSNVPFVASDRLACPCASFQGDSLGVHCFVACVLRDAPSMLF